MTSGRRAHGSSLVLLTAATACGGREAAPTRAAIRDSAGIEIVESPAPASARRLRIEPEPVLVIGTATGPPETALFRVAGAVRLPDGRIVVANGGTNELRFFAAGGGFLLAVGGDGEGPGEFAGLTDLELSGDTLLAFDRRRSAVQLFDLEGRFVRSARIAAPVDAPFPRFIGRLSDGSLLLASEPIFFTGQSRTGVVRDTLSYFRVDAAGGPARTVARAAAPATWVESTERSVTAYGLPFAPESHAAVAGDGWYLGDGDRFEVRLLDAEGAVRRIARVASPRRKVERTHVRQYKETALEEASGVPEWRSRLAELLERIPWEYDSFPAFVGLQVDGRGRLWIGLPRPPGEARTTWIVLDPSGRAIGEVAAPPQLRLIHVGADFVLGRAVDDLGVESIRLHRLAEDERG